MSAAPTLSQHLDTVDLHGSADSAPDSSLNKFAFNFSASSAPELLLQFLDAGRQQLGLGFMTAAACQQLFRREVAQHGVAGNGFAPGPPRFRFPKVFKAGSNGAGDVVPAAQFPADIAHRHHAHFPHFSPKGYGAHAPGFLHAHFPGVNRQVGADEALTSLSAGQLVGRQPRGWVSQSAAFALHQRQPARRFAQHLAQGMVQQVGGSVVGLMSRRRRDLGGDVVADAMVPAPLRPWWRGRRPAGSPSPLPPGPAAV